MAHLIGTAGHVDHGKTTLIAALTGIDADRLPEEKARGMTIDIGFAFLDLPEHGRVSLIDVPGHERFIKNMLAGASGVDVALLCVAADEGVKPQTIEHFEILRLLGVAALVVAVTKSELLSDENTFEEVREMLAGTPYESSPVLPVSAVTGEGLDELRKALQKTIQRLPRKHSSSGWMLPIDRVFTVQGHGTIVTGTLAMGEISEGTEAVLMPGSLSARIRNVQVHGRDVPSAEPGQRVALNIAGVKKESLERGQVLCAPGVCVETNQVGLRIEPSGVLLKPERVRVHLGSGEFLARLLPSKDDPSVAILKFEKPVACALGQKVVLRKYSPPSLLAGGSIIATSVSGKRRTVTDMSEGHSLVDRILSIVTAAPKGVTSESVSESLGLTPQEIGDAFEELKSSGRMHSFAGTWMSLDAYEGLRNRVVEELRKWHDAHPQSSGIRKTDLHAAMKLQWTAKAFDRLVSRLALEEVLMQSGNELRLPDFQVQINSKQALLLDRLVLRMRESGVLAPERSDLARDLGVPPQAIDEMIRLGLEVGRLVDVGDGLVYPKEVIEDCKEKTRKLGDRFTVAQFRDATGSSRKYALPILQYLDECHFTRRVGDERIVIG